MSTDRPLVTLILLAFKQERFIREAVQSALSQTYIPLEIVISDDCSPDKTFSVIQEVVGHYRGPHEIILNRNPRNLGIGAHLQTAFMLCSGEWIVAAAGDDISEPTRVTRLVEATQAVDGVVAAASSWKNIDSNGRRLKDNLPKRFRNGGIHQRGKYDWVHGFIKERDTGIPGMSAMWHRSLFSCFPAMNETIAAEDIVLGFRAYLTGSIVFLKEQLIMHRLHDSNISAPIRCEPLSRKSQIVHFAIITRPSLYANLTDYDYYLYTHPQISSDPSILKLISISLWKNKLICEWNKFGIFEKIANMAKLACICSYSSIWKYILACTPR